MKIEGLSKLRSTLRKMQVQASKDNMASVTVGYTQSYALALHENLEMKWKGLPRSGEVKFHKYEQGRRIVRETNTSRAGYHGFYWDPLGQAKSKFLEDPARELGPQLGAMCAKAAQNGATLEQALLICGLRLQRESQLQVPVDLGALKASAFTSLTRLEESAAAASFSKSESIRKSGEAKRSKGK